MSQTEAEDAAAVEPKAEPAPCQCQSYLRGTEHAALASARWLGRADQEAAEEAAAAGMRQTLDQDFIQTGVAKGLRRRRLMTAHVVPNALPPVLTVLGIQIGQLLGGAIIVETIFAWPGIGQLLLQAGTTGYSVFLADQATAADFDALSVLNPSP